MKITLNLTSAQLHTLQRLVRDELDTQKLKTEKAVYNIPTSMLQNREMWEKGVAEYRTYAAEQIKTLSAIKDILANAQQT